MPENRSQASQSKDGAMLTTDTELLDTAKIVDVPADLSTPFDHLTNSDTDAGQR